jgi:hypothetical protein
MRETTENVESIWEHINKDRRLTILGPARECSSKKIGAFGATMTGSIMTVCPLTHP